MNSLDTCLEILKILPTQFDLNRCICNLGMEGTEVTQEQAQESLDAVIQASQEDIEKKLETMFAILEAKVQLLDFDCACKLLKWHHSCAHV